MRELEKESESIKEVTRSYTNEINQHYTGYDHSYYDSGAFGGGSQPSIEANPSTVGVPATQGAESSVSPAETQVNGTVARTTRYGSDPDHPAEPEVVHPAEPESINT